ncbi:MAG: glycosyltransferase family 4 protein [Deltaproteobacteria bacterium]|nr:glycosyltransferase family 4 protein [Deltaproteobacteria bacterium]
MPRAVFDMVRVQKSRYNVGVVTTRIYNNVADSFCDEDISVLYLRNLSSKMAFNYQLYTPIPHTKLFSIVKKADIIHFHGHRNLLNDLIFYIARIFNKPYIITTHGTLHSYESKRLVKSIYDVITGNRFVRDAKYIVVHSEVERSKLTSLGISPSKIRVIPNGIYFDDLNSSSDQDFFKKFGIGERERVILFLGKITRRKGLEVALDAFRRIKDGSLKLIVAGEVIGELPEDVMRDERVKYIGHLELEDKISAILSSVMLLYPSIYEAFGYVPFEALYLKRPCIIGDDFGTSEHLSKVVPELVVSYGDSIELSELMKRLLEDKEMREHVVEKGRVYVMKEFHIEKMIDKYDELYRDIIGGLS